MATVPSIVAFNDIPPFDEFWLNSGYPGVELMEKSAQAFDKAASDCMSNPQSWTELMLYGPENGAESFRKTLASFLSRQYQSEVVPDELFITAGASFGVTLLSTALFEAGDFAFVADPTYFLVFDMLRMGKLSLTCVSTDEQGMVPAALEEAIVQQSTKHPARPLTENKPYRGLIYLIPTYDNPTGKCLSDDRCKQIIDIARRYKLLIVCDDVYNLVYFTDKPPRRLYSYDTRTDAQYMGSVVSNCSFSKIFSPGMRLGWIEAPYRVLSLLLTSGVAASGGGFNHLMSMIMNSAILLGHLDRIVEENRAIVKSQCEAMTEILLEELPKGVQVSCPLGGFYVWITLPESTSAQAILDECLKDKIKFHVGNKFSLNDNFKNCFRISYSFYKVDVLQIATRKLATVICKHLQENDTVFK